MQDKTLGRTKGLNTGSNEVTKWTTGEHNQWLKPGAHCVIYNSPLRWLLVRLYVHDPHVTLCHLSCHLCQTVRQSTHVKKGRTHENLSGVLHHQPTHIQWLWAALHAGLKWWLTKTSLALILITACLEKWRQFDVCRRRSHTAGLCAKSSDTARISSEVKIWSQQSLTGCLWTCQTSDQRLQILG